MMKTGGCSAAPRRHASSLAGPHPCLPPAGEGEKARGEGSHLSRLYSLPHWGRVRVGAARRGRSALTPALPPLFPPPLGEGEGGGHQKRKTLSHPCPLPQAGEGVHTKFIATSACCMGARGILHDGNWRLSCSAKAAWIKPGRPPSLPSPRGGRKGSQRGKERKPEGKGFTSPASIPSPTGGG